MARFKSLTFKTYAKVISYVAEYVIKWIFMAYNMVKNGRPFSCGPLRHMDGRTDKPTIAMDDNTACCISPKNDASRAFHLFLLHIVTTRRMDVCPQCVTT